MRFITIQNLTNHVLLVETTRGYVKSYPGMFTTLERDPNATYREFRIRREHEINASGHDCFYTTGDIFEYAELSIYTTEGDFEQIRGTWRGARAFPGKDFGKLKKNASVRMKTILLRSSKSELHLKNIKICHAQIKHLVQTFSECIQRMAGIYTQVFQVEDNIRSLYDSNKLRILVKFLECLENCVRDTEEFLLEWTRERKLLALQVSMLLRSPATTTRSKFDHLIGELRWNLDKIRYALCSEEELSTVEWKWCTIRCRHVLIEEGRGGVDHEGSDLSLVNSDRDDFRRHLEDRSIFAENKLLNPRMWFPQNGSGEAFGEILKKRLCTERCTSSTSKSSSIPVEIFWINHLDLKYKSTKPLNKGSVKSIYRGEWFGLEVAIAVMVQRDALERLVEKEAGFLVELQHPNIVAFYGYSYTRDARLPGSKSPTAAAYLVMELMEGDLLGAIESRWRSTGPFSISVTLDIMLQIVEAMVYLHEQDIIHRDLKPSNCLVKARSAPPDVHYAVKLTDFGSAREVDAETTSDLLTVNPGTTRWMAPEMFGTCKGSWERVKYTKSADVYGFAIICYQVVTGVETPMPEIMGKNVVEAVRNGERPKFPAYLSCPEGLKQLIINCWHEEPASRPTFVEIRETLWTIRKNVELQE